MKKILKKFVEIYAKSSTNSCLLLIFHQPKAPKCLIQK
ncbi:MAG: cyclic lactone autoinducer peptide [Clostridia bacterium]|nr:cyclic lactone autoinducer peptide [Clostridia bacterium]MDD4387160.1 cyclic lactone autoinducer peptide [Clostridia bacterium]